MKPFMIFFRSDEWCICKFHGRRSGVFECPSVCSWFYQWHTNIVQGNTNGNIGNTIGTNGNANDTICFPNSTVGTIGKPMVPLVKLPTNGTIGRTPNRAQACVHGSTNGTNGIQISFKVPPMVPLVKPLVPMVMPMVPLGNPEQSPGRVFHVISVQFICYTSRFASKTVPRASIQCILINITDRSMLYYRSLVERQSRGPMVLSGPTVSTKTNRIVLKWAKVNSGSSFI